MLRPFYLSKATKLTSVTQKGCFFVSDCLSWQLSAGSGHTAGRRVGWEHSHWPHAPRRPPWRAARPCIELERIPASWNVYSVVVLAHNRDAPHRPDSLPPKSATGFTMHAGAEKRRSGLDETWSEVYNKLLNWRSGRQEYGRLRMVAAEPLSDPAANDRVSDKNGSPQREMRTTGGTCSKGISISQGIVSTCVAGSAAAGKF